LPALLRLIVPAAAAIGSSDGVSGVATAGAGFAGRMASGAVAHHASKHSNSSKQQATGAATGKGSEAGTGSSSRAVGRKAAGALAMVAKQHSNGRSGLSGHANEIVQGALPGIHDGENH